MALTDGSGYTLPSPTTCYKSGANGTSSFAYGSTSRSISNFQVLYYHNDDLIYTSALSTATVYPMIVNYFQDSNKINALSSDAGQITWTLQSGYTGNEATIMLGADNQHGSADYSNMSYAFQFDGNPVKLISIKESGTAKATGLDRTVTNGDTFKLVISSAGPTSSTTFYPPPPAYITL